MRLLRAWLSPKQRDQFDSFWYFDVVGSATGKKYRIHFGGPTCRKLAKMGCQGEASASYPRLFDAGLTSCLRKRSLWKQTRTPASAGIFGARKNILTLVGSYTRLG